MKLNTNATFKSLINTLGNVSYIKPPTKQTLIDIHKLKIQNEKYQHIVLYSGGVHRVADWTKINCNCVYFHDEGTLHRQVVLSRIAKFNPEIIPHDMDSDPYPNDDKDYKVFRIKNYLPHVNVVTYGNLINIGKELSLKNWKSLLIPVELEGARDFDSMDAMVQDVKMMNMLERIILCTGNDNTWRTINKMLMS